MKAALERVRAALPDASSGAPDGGKGGSKFGRLRQPLSNLLNTGGAAAPSSAPLQAAAEFAPHQLVP